MANSKIESAALVVLTICALTVTALLIRKEFGGVTKQERLTSRIRNWRRDADGGHDIGGADSALTLTIFTDFQCPYCRAFVAVVDALRTRYPQVRIVERDFPLSEIHANAFAAALAAECASIHGRYGAMRRQLYANQQLVSRDAWGRLAWLAGIRDTTALRACVLSEQEKSRVLADLKFGNDVGVRGTPTVFLNDVEYSVPPSLLELDDAIRLLKRTR